MRRWTPPTPSTGTLGDFLDDGGYGAGFRRHFLVPITSAVWSTGAARILDFPIDYLLRFLDHHGLIGYGNALQWRTIQGGSMRYVDRIVASLPPGTIRSGSPVVDVVAQRGRVSRSGPRTAARERFDAVVMATHADQALAVLHDADGLEHAALGGFDYSTNQVVLHTDERVLPRRPRRARLMERRSGGLRATGRGAHDDVPHELAAIAGRAGAVLACRSTPAIASAPTGSSWSEP